MSEVLFQDNGLIFFSRSGDPPCVFAGGWRVDHTLGLGNPLRLPLVVTWVTERCAF